MNEKYIHVLYIALGPIYILHLKLDLIEFVRSAHLITVSKQVNIYMSYKARKAYRSVAHTKVGISTVSRHMSESFALRDQTIFLAASWQWNVLACM